MASKLAVQLYTVREFTKTAAGFADTLARIQKIGYPAVQLSAVGCMNGETPEVSAVQARKMLDDHGLKCVATHSGWEQLAGRTEQEIECLNTLGCNYTAIGGMAAEYRKDFAVHGHTAAEMIIQRADSRKPNMGLTTWGMSPDGKILKTDVVIAKNYLTKDELGRLGRMVNAYLDLAEERAHRKIPMTMQDWAGRLDAFLEFTESDILQDGGKVTAELAKAHAESEFEKYRIVQDRLFESDFDKDVKKLLEEKEGAANGSE